MTRLDQEHLHTFAKGWLENPNQPKVDAFIFGHRHLPLNVTVEGHSATYLNTGDWLTHFTSAVVTGGQAFLVEHRPR